MKKLTFILLAFLVIAGCQSKSITGETITLDGGFYKNVSPAELNTMLKTRDFVFINVHIPFEGNIAGTDISIPYDQISEPNYLAQIPVDKNAKILLYCRGGRMSAMAAEELVSLGYTNIWNLDGGMVAWEQAGNEIEK
ncbi:MAG: rhodanese-like domain-containing protein [Chloroflexi bacterium]|nr:rhodanese-like domain-containing protein [Chloroflexota bacterium]